MILGLPVLAILIGLLVLLGFVIGRTLKWMWPGAPTWRISVAASLPGPALVGIWAVRMLMRVHAHEVRDQCGVDACGFAGFFAMAALVSSVAAFLLSLWFLSKSLRKPK